MATQSHMVTLMYNKSAWDVMVTIFDNYITLVFILLTPKTVLNRNSQSFEGTTNNLTVPIIC